MKEVTSTILIEQKEIDELKKQVDARDDEANHIVKSSLDLFERKMVNTCAKAKMPSALEKS